MSGEKNSVQVAVVGCGYWGKNKEALLHGKDVFVEKPLALKYQEGRELVEIAASKGAILMVV